MPEIDVRPMRSLGLLSVAHAVNHAQAVITPFIFLGLIDEFGASVEQIAYLAAIGAFSAGIVQLSYAGLTRVVSRRRLLGYGGILFGGGFALQAFASSFLTFAIPNVASRIGSSPQHPVGNGLLAEQFPTERAASRSVPTSRAATSARSSWLSSARPHRRGRLARRIDLFGIPAIVVAVLDPHLRPRARHRPGRGQAQAARCDRPCGTLLRTATCAGSTSRRRSGVAAGPRGREPVRPHLPDPGPRPVRRDGRADVRGADRLLGPDAADRGLAVGSGRPASR